MKATRAAAVAKLVVVIDDDPLVLEATGGLLRSSDRVRLSIVTRTDRSRRH